MRAPAARTRPRPPLVGLLATAAGPAGNDPERWQEGLAFGTSSCGRLRVLDPCGPDVISILDRPGVGTDYDPFVVQAYADCSTGGGAYALADAEQRATDDLDALTGLAVERELWTGDLARAAGWPNRALTATDADVTAGKTRAEALTGSSGGVGRPAPTTSTATTGGTLPAGSYTYRVAAVNATGEGLPSGPVTQVVPAGPATNTVTVSWPAVPGATGYRVYGRTGTTGLLASPTGLSYVDTGADSPSGQQPQAFDGSRTFESLTPRGALAVLEEALGTFPGAGTIHAGLRAATWLRPEIIRDGNLLRTILGTTVVAGAGYLTTGPDGAPPPAGTAWLYGTGPVTVRLGPPTVPAAGSAALDRATNTVRVVAERTAAATWDGCAHVAVLMNLTAD